MVYLPWIAIAAGIGKGINMTCQYIGWVLLVLVRWLVGWFVVGEGLLTW